MQNFVVLHSEGAEQRALGRFFGTSFWGIHPPAPHFQTCSHFQNSTMCSHRQDIRLAYARNTSIFDDKHPPGRHLENAKKIGSTLGGHLGKGDCPKNPFRHSFTSSFKCTSDLKIWPRSDLQFSRSSAPQLTPQKSLRPPSGQTKSLSTGSPRELL